MRELALGPGGRMTTQLGYGCSGLMGSLSQRESLALLHAAFDAGIRHFDVAPLYGFGAAEGCLGRFLQHHRHEVTVTTKFGLPAAKHRRLLGAARGLAARVAGLAPSVKRRLAKVANRAAATGARSPFTAERAMASLHGSLRQLRVERVDLFLMHEAAAADLDDDGLLEALRRAAEAGTIGGFGVGSEAAKIRGLVEARPAYCRVLQFDWSALDPEPAVCGSFRIHHRSLGEDFRSLQRLLAESPVTAKRWSEAVGVDLSAPGALGRVMVRAALDHNPDGMLLFSSRDAGRMRANVAIAEAPATAGVSAAFRALLMREGVKAPTDRGGG